VNNIDLASLEIEGMGARQAVTGAQIFEIGGPDVRKADALATQLREVLGDREGVKIARPVQTAEIRVRDLDDSVRCEDVAKAVSSAGGCTPDAVKVGDIRTSGRGLDTAWMRCPTAAVNKIAAKKLRIGWSIVRVEALERRPLSASGVWREGTPLPNVATALTEASTAISAESQGTSPRAARRRSGAPSVPAWAARLTTASAPSGAPLRKRKGGAAKKQSTPPPNSLPGEKSDNG